MAEQHVTFKEVVDENFSTLDFYTKAIVRAHGRSHPEAYEVRRVFEAMKDKVEQFGAEGAHLATDFIKLRKVTNNYTLPEDVCQTFASVYEMLEKADQVYHTS